MEIWAHRGASALAPENTMAAFNKAHELGVDAIELDVHRSADGVLVVIHDETLTRTTQGRGYVQAASFSWLRTLDAGYKFHSSFRGERIPSLAEVLSFVRSTPMSINIEIKNDRIPYPGIEREVLELVSEYDMDERVVISSFNHRTIRRVLALDEDMSVGLLCTEFKPVAPVHAKRLGAGAIHVGAGAVNPAFMTEALRMRVAVRPYTVNNPRAIRTLHAWGVDAVITDDPVMAKRALQSP